MVTGTKQLKERAIYIYLPSTKMAEEWKEGEELQKQSVSKFVIEHVLNSLKQADKEKSGEAGGQASRSELIRQLREKDEELKEIEPRKRDSIAALQQARCSMGLNIQSLVPCLPGNGGLRFCFTDCDATDLWITNP